MEIKNNTLRLNEQEFNKLVEQAVFQVLEEGKFGDMAKKFGKGVGKAALYGALGAGTLYAMDKGLENQEAYEQSLNQQAKVMSGPSTKDVMKYLEIKGMEDTPQNRDAAWEYLNNRLQTESKKQNRLSKILREEISKVLA